MRVDDLLNYYGKKIVKEAKTNLTKKKKNASKKLYDSISYNVESKNGKHTLSFSMEDYGEFIDKGVKGNESSAKAPNSPYKYTSKMPPIKSLDKWIVKRGLASRNSKGQFISRESLKFAIAKSIQKTGIETTNFFSIPLEQNFDKFPDELLNSFIADIEL